MKPAKQAKLKTLLEAGWSRRAAADELAVSPSTVTRWARILGFPDKTPRPTQVVWEDVQAHYDEGHSISECKARFGFSYGAWDKAVARGDLVPRPRANRELSRSTRDQVEDLLARGISQAEIARTLGLSKSTVAYHVRSLGVRADPRFARRLDWTAVQQAIDEEGLSMSRCLERFGVGRDSWYRAVRRGDLVPRPHTMGMEELLVVGRRTSRSHLKRRLVKAGLKQNRCERCGITRWHGKPLSLQLHHVNGDGLDNRLVNLEILCPNCHSQTDTWGGRNRSSGRLVEAAEEAA